MKIKVEIVIGFDLCDCIVVLVSLEIGLIIICLGFLLVIFLYSYEDNFVCLYGKDIFFFITKYVLVLSLEIGIRLFFLFWVNVFVLLFIIEEFLFLNFGINLEILCILVLLFI